MEEFISIDVFSTLEKHELLYILSTGFAEFRWRMGDSDAQGGYVSGRHPLGASIKCLTGEQPFVFSVSFRESKLNRNEMRAIREKLLRDILPQVGTVACISEG